MTGYAAPMESSPRSGWLAAAFTAAIVHGTMAAGLYGVGSEFEKQLVAMTPLGRVGTPDDIAKVVAFLAS